MSSYNLNCKNFEYTRICYGSDGKVSKSKIDYFLTNLSTRLYEENVVNLHIADHQALILELNVNPNQTEDKQTINEYRETNEFNVRMLCEQIRRETFLDMYKLRDINEIYKCFMETITYHIDLYCPIKYTKQKYNRSSWVTREVLDSSKNLKSLFWLTKQTNDEAVKNQYSAAKKEYKKGLELAKNQYYNHRINSVSNNKNRKIIWSLVNERTGKVKRQDNVSLKIGEKLITEGNLVAHEFGKYFTVETSMLVNQHFRNATETCTKQNNNCRSFFFRKTVKEDVMETIKNLKSTSSMGNDCIPTDILKAIGESIAEPLAYIINQSVGGGQFPDCLKLGKILPIFKKGDPCSVQNYRPITLLSVVSKVIEGVVCKKIISFLDQYSIITDCQHGFRRGRSTQTAMHDFAQFSYHCLDSGRYVAVLLADLTKAFDSVDPEILSEKLEAIGFRGNFLQWIMSYMTNRRICVSTNYGKSEYFDVSLGVPQGSALGPLIFCLYVNDLPNFITVGKVLLYADDTTIIVEADTPEELEMKLNIANAELALWCKRNRLIVNASKTQCMHIYNRRSIPTINVGLDGNTMDFVDIGKLLGVFINSNMSWRAHIDHVCGKLGSTYWVLLQLKKILGTKELLNIYYALAYSHLNYNVIIWGNATNCARVFVLQKRLLRLIFGLGSRDSCRSLFREKRYLRFPAYISANAFNMLEQIF